MVKSPGQLLTEAQARTPLLGPSGPACTLSFEYALTGNPGHIGEWSQPASPCLLLSRCSSLTPCAPPQVSCPSG